MIKRTTVRLPAELLRKAKRKADAEGRTLTALMEDGLRYVVSDKPTSERKPRPEIPISKASGGMMPGITNPRRDIEELDDLEYIERLNRGFK
jgi:hypothetical protein